jgi:hypothetical protein
MVIVMLGYIVFDEDIIHQLIAGKISEYHTLQRLIQVVDTNPGGLGRSYE